MTTYTFKNVSPYSRCNEGADVKQMLCFSEDHTRPRLKLTGLVKRTATGEAQYMCAVLYFRFFLCVAIYEYSKKSK